MPKNQEGTQKTDATRGTQTPRPSSEGEVGRFHERLALILEGRSVRSFARAAGVSGTVLRKYLAGTSEPTRPALIAMARAGGVTVTWLAMGLEPKLVKDQTPGQRDTETIVLGEPDDPEVIEAWRRRDRSIKDFAAGFAAGQQTPSEQGSQNVRPEGDTLQPDLISAAVRITEDVLRKYGVRDLATPQQFGDLVQVVYQDLVHGKADQAASEAIDRVMNIARVLQPQ